MRFYRVDYPPGKQISNQDTCYLINDNWDNFSFKTLFSVEVFDDQGDRHDLGAIRIMQ